MAESDIKMTEHIHSQKHNHFFKEIYKKTFPKVRKYILANSGSEQDVEDIFQDAILIFYNQLSSGKFQQEAPTDPYLYRIARNLYINLVKKHSRVYKTQLTEHPDDSQDSLLQMIEKEQKHSFNKLFLLLDDRCRELLTLRIVQNRSMKEIVTKMGFANENVAKTMVYRSKMRLLNLAKRHGMLNSEQFYSDLA